MRKHPFNARARHTHTRSCVASRGRKEDGWRSCVLFLAYPPKFTSVAYNVYPFSGGDDRHSRRAFHHSLVHSKLPLGTPELRPGTRRVYAYMRLHRTRSRMTSGKHSGERRGGTGGRGRREGGERGRETGDERKFATGSLMSLKQKTPSSITACSCRAPPPAAM